MGVFGIFSGKTLHPLVDPKETKLICADLAQREPLAALEQAAVWLEALVELQDIKLPLRIERLDQIDNATMPQARRLSRLYLSRMSFPDAQRASEASVWQVGHSYWSRLADAYSDCLNQYEAPETDSTSKKASKSMMPFVYARLMFAYAERRKWELYQYKPAEPEFWSAVGGLYARAVTSKLESKDIVLYPGLAYTTIELEYFKVLLLQSSSPDKLPLVEIEIADRLLVHFLNWFIFTKELRRDNMYWVDIRKSLPPTRMAKVPEPSDALRFFSGGGALAAIAQLLDEIKREKRVPAKVALGASYDADTVSRVLEHLSTYWSPTPPTRSHERRPVKSSLNVVNGLALAHRHISGLGSMDVDHFRWQADDISLGGMSAKISEGRQDWINIGVLIALQPEGGSNWIVGVVRRYVRINARQGTVGIQTLSRSPRSVVADAGGLQTDALLLDTPVVGEYARMALSPAALEERVTLKFALDDMNALLHPREVLERGQGFVVANFFVQSFC